MSSETEMCKCIGWARDGRDGGVGLWEHHPNCPRWDPVGDTRRMLTDLVSGIEEWASDEDNEVHPDCWDAYERALYAIGERPGGAHIVRPGPMAEPRRWADFRRWLDAEIEAARQLNRQDPIATRSALERVKARMP
jgi:hypothetical protein